MSIKQYGEQRGHDGDDATHKGDVLKRYLQLSGHRVSRELLQGKRGGGSEA